MEISALKLKDLQPSQFYISEKKLRDIEGWLDPADLSCFEPIPVKLLDGRPVMTDGHTRAVAALRAGLEAVPLVWDEDELSWDMYRACVAACREQAITSPCQLLSRIIPEEEYREKWDKWCDRMQAEIERKMICGGKHIGGQELYQLAMKHIYGDGVPEDNSLAFTLLTQAHDMGHIEATYNLGICYHYGYGTSVDLARAFELYLESANAGFGKGMELVGRFYNRGIYVKQDRKQAGHWLYKAIESSDPAAVEEAKKELAFEGEKEEHGKEDHV